MALIFSDANLSLNKYPFLPCGRFFVLFLVLALNFSPSSASKVAQRNLKTFLPKSGETIDAPKNQLVQVLLDRQPQGQNESYMVQVLFHHSPAEHTFMQLEDRIVFDFLDCGKPAMRLAKIRGGIISASAVEELYYKEPIKKFTGIAQSSPVKKSSIKRMVRLTLFTDKKPGEIKLRDTLDRTLIHFSTPNPAKHKE